MDNWATPTEMPFHLPLSVAALDSPVTSSYPWNHVLDLHKLTAWTDCNESSNEWFSIYDIDIALTGSTSIYHAGVFSIVSPAKNHNKKNIISSREEPLSWRESLMNSCSADHSATTTSGIASSASRIAWTSAALGISRRGRSKALTELAAFQS